MRYCTNCGKESPEGSAICSDCGSSISENTVTKHEIEVSVEGTVSKYNKIRGALILVLLGRVYGILAFPIAIYGYFEMINKAYYDNIKIAINIDFSYYALVFIFDIFALYLMFNRKKAFPYIMITFTLVSLAYYIFKYFIYKYLGVFTKGDTLLKSILFSTVSCAIWIPYFLKSKRVKRTFIE